MTTLPLSGTITTGGNGATVNLDALSVPSFDLTKKALRLSLTISDVTKIGNLIFFVGVGGLSNTLKWRFDAETSSSKIGKSGERFDVVLNQAELDAAAGTLTLDANGVPSTTTGFTAARFQASDNATGPITVTVHEVEIVAATTNDAGGTGSKGLISICFDDSDLSVLSFAAPRMAMYGYRGTAYTLVDALGTAGRLTLADLHTLHDEFGWPIGGHAYATALHDAALGYGSSAAAAVRADLESLHSWLEQEFPLARGSEHIGYPFAYPKGIYQDTTDDVAIETLVAEAGFQSGRTILAEVGVQSHASVNERAPARRPPMEFRLYAMSAISSVASGTSPALPANLAGAGGMLDRVAANGGWLILVFHKIVTGTPAATTEIQEESFNSILAAIHDNGLLVRTVGDIVALDQ